MGRSRDAIASKNCMQKTEVANKAYLQVCRLATDMLIASCIDPTMHTFHCNVKSLFLTRGIRYLDFILMAAVVSFRQYHAKFF